MAIQKLCSLQYVGQLLKLRNFSVSGLLYKYRVYSSTNEPFTPLFLNMEPWLDNNAITDKFGSHTYRDVLQSSCNLSREIRKMIEVRNHSEPRLMTKVAIACERDVSFVVSLYGCWLAGVIPIPFSFYFLDRPRIFMSKTKCAMIIATDMQAASDRLLQKQNKPLKVLRETDYVKVMDKSLGFWDIIDSRNHGPNKEEYMKLVNTNHFRNIPAIIFCEANSQYRRTVDYQVSFGNIHTRLQSLATAMNCTSQDVVLHMLPLNHAYCIIDALLLQLFCGARTILPDTRTEDSKHIWKELLPENKESRQQVNRVMAYLALYSKMMKNYITLPYIDKINLAQDLKDISMYAIADSGNLYSVAYNWYEMTDNVLSVLYTNSECGPVMVTQANVFQKIQNYLYRGKILPGVKGRIMLYKDGGGHEVIVEFDGPEVVQVSENMFFVEGELQLKGPGSIENYISLSQHANTFSSGAWSRENFTSDGWFRTRDMAMIDNSENICISSPYSLQWMDKSGRIVFALLIRGRLMEHPLIEKAEIFRIPNHQFKNSVAAAVVLKQFRFTITLEDIQQFMRHSGLEDYLIPAMVTIYSELPRHANQSVNRRQLQGKLFFS